MHATSEFLVPNSWILGGGVDSRHQWSGSFDDIQSSVMALFEVSTLNNWGIIRATGVDATAALQPSASCLRQQSMEFTVFLLPIKRKPGVRIGP